MSDDVVKAEVHAVRALKHGIERYAEHIRDAAAKARREMAAADQKAQAAVERRRAETRKREQEVRQAEAALRQCRENCGGLQQQARKAAERLAEAKRSLERARKAAALTASAQSDLLKALISAEATVADHSSVASSALATLEAKLTQLPAGGPHRALHNTVVGLAVSGEIVGASLNLGRVAGNTLHAFNVNVPIGDATTAEMVEHDRDQEVEYKFSRDFEEQKRLNSGQDEEATP